MAAIRYKIEDIIFLFMKKPPDKINYNTQKDGAVTDKEVSA